MTEEEAKAKGFKCVERYTKEKLKELNKEAEEITQQWVNENNTPVPIIDEKGHEYLLYPQSPEYWKKKPETKKDDEHSV
jgi:hypothetical protein